jgi:hypothetical protein
MVRFEARGYLFNSDRKLANKYNGGIGSGDNEKKFSSFFFNKWNIFVFVLPDIDNN